DGYVLTLDTSQLPPGHLLILQSPLGWHALKTGAHPQQVYLHLQPLSPFPGKARALALQRLSQSWGQQIRSLKSMSNWQSRLLLAQLLEDGWTPELRR